MTNPITAEYVELTLYLYRLLYNHFTSFSPLCNQILSFPRLVLKEGIQQEGFPAGSCTVLVTFIWVVSLFLFVFNGVQQEEAWNSYEPSLKRLHVVSLAISARLLRSCCWFPADWLCLLSELQIAGRQMKMSCSYFPSQSTAQAAKVRRCWRDLAIRMRGG